MIDTEVKVVNERFAETFEYIVNEYLLKGCWRVAHASIFARGNDEKYLAVLVKSPVPPNTTGGTVEEYYD